MIAEQEARGDFSKREPTVMPISIHSFHAPSGIGMNFHNTSQKPAAWRSSRPVLQDSWSTPDPRLLRGDRRIYSLSHVFKQVLGLLLFYPPYTVPAGPITFRMIPVLYSEEEEEFLILDSMSAVMSFTC